MNTEIAILGVGMHPWGKWGKNFVEYGLVAARAALADAGIDWRKVQFVSGAATIRCGYPGYVAGATFAQALGWQGAQVNTSYAACASGSQALAAARSKILSGECEVALVIGADTTPKGFLAPQKGERPDDPDWVRFRVGITNPTYFGLYARRRMGLYGDTQEDFARVKASKYFTSAEWRRMHSDGTTTRWLQQVTDFFVEAGGIQNPVPAAQYFDPKVYLETVKA